MDLSQAKDFSSNPLQFGSASLASAEHLKLRSEFQYVREHGEKFVGRYFIILAADSPDGSRRHGIICSKRFSKKAVTRNRARRLLRESFRLLKARIAPRHLVFIPRKSIIGQKLQAVQQDMLHTLRRASLWMEEDLT